MVIKIGKYSLMQSKQQIMEIAFVLFVIASCAIAAVIGAYVYKQVGQQLNASSFNTAVADTAYNKVGQGWYILDNAMIFVVIGLTIGLIVTSFLIPTHPVFVLINIVGFLILVFIGAVYSNTYFSVVNTSAEMLNASTTYFPHTAWTMGRLPFFAAVLVFLCSVVMYTKGKQY